MTNFAISGRSSASTLSSGGADVAASSQLAKCKLQLGDWTACPTGKTPEGQKIIQNLRAQISRLEQRVQGPAATTAADSSLNYRPGGIVPMRLDLWA